MSASIFGTRFLGHREPAWHQLGQVFEEPIDASTGFKRAGLDYATEKRELFVDYYGDKISTGKFALLRGAHVGPDGTTDAPKVLGFVGEGYQALDNMTDIAATLDPLTAVWPVETCGALGDGETIFVSLDVSAENKKPHKVGGLKGEEIKEYFVFSDGKGNGRAARFMYTPVRPVCTNTLMAAEQEAVFTAQLFHNKAVVSELKFRTELIGRLRTVRNETLAVFDAMALARVTDEQVDEIINRVYPMPKKSQKANLKDFLAENMSKLDGVDLSRLDDAQRRFELWSENLKVFRAGAHELYQRICDGGEPGAAGTGAGSSIAGTAYAVYNAIAESADWRRGSGGETGAARIAASTLFGYRAQEKRAAYKAVKELVLASAN